MTHEEKINWMIIWAHKHQVVLTLQGECGIGRECVGILSGKNYPDYDDDESVWYPEDAYHKHPCVAVLGRGEVAEAQLYDWLKWFDENNYEVRTIARNLEGMSQIALMLHGTESARMVKKEAT